MYNLSKSENNLIYLSMIRQILGVGHRACKNIISRVCGYYLSCGRLRKTVLAQVSGGGYHLRILPKHVTGHYRHR